MRWKKTFFFSFAVPIALERRENQENGRWSRADDVPLKKRGRRYARTTQVFPRLAPRPRDLVLFPPFALCVEGTSSSSGYAITLNSPFHDQMPEGGWF